MKSTVFIILLAFFFHPFSTKAQEELRIDSLAVYIIQQMGHTILNVESCSFITDTDYDVWQEDLGYVKHSGKSHIYMKFPDKVKVNFSGDRGRRTMIYNGNKFVYYSYAKNHYSEVPIRGNIVNMMDSVNRVYGIEFPAADFFYPSFLTDLISTGGSLVYLGISRIGDKDCFHIAGKDTEGNGFQFWIADDNFFLPVKMVITYKEDNGNPQFEAIYSGWEINPRLSDSMFEFVVPPSANKIQLSSAGSR